MKKFSLLLLSFLVLSCSSDDEAATIKDNFLDVYNGVIWEYTNASDSKDDEWAIFSPESFIEYGDGCQKATSLWGVENANGDTHTVDKNSKNLLIFNTTESSGGEAMTSKLTVSENGNVMTGIYSDSVDSQTVIYNKVSEACK